MRIQPVLMSVILFLVLIVFGCASEINNPEAIVDDGDNESNATEAVLVQSPEGSCVPQWKCASSTTRRFQESNCSFKAQEKCSVGCDFETNNCTTVQCDEGYFCESPDTRAFRDKYCAWMLQEPCAFGCKNGACLNETEAAILVDSDKTNTTAAAETPSDPYAGVEWLNAQEQVEVPVGNMTYLFSVRILEADRTKIKFGDATSDWLKEGDTVLFVGGQVTITLVEINFQPYEGGLKRIGYKISVN
ncbi:hypothetical protein J4210_06665 [Candidatus Woesearchaeota archaeon]|nr:hypothetical protein [Candidatus Woesearchaeota archaeon]